MSDEELRQRLTERLGDNATPWQKVLLDVDPGFLERMLVYRSAFYSGPLSEKLKQLIFTAVNAVVTHIVHEGIRAHAARALEEGATVAEVLDALAISSVVSSRGAGRGIPIVVEELTKAGLPMPGDADPAHVAAARQRIAEQLGELPGWVDVELEVDPDIVAAFVAYGQGPSGDDGLDEKSRQLVFIAVAGSPAVADPELTRYHVQRAIAAGATGEEMIHALRAGNGMGLHTIFFGAVELQAARDVT